MKTAVAFLFVAVTYCLASSLHGYTAPGGHDADHFPKKDVPIISKDCLKKLLQHNLPNILETLQRLLCLYEQGKKENNEKLFKEFLTELHEALKNAGCAVDEILSLEEFLEKIGDQVGEVAKELVKQILDLAEQLELLKPLAGLLCGVLGDTLGNLASALGGKGKPAGGKGGFLPIPLLG